jgi:transposase-like protein
LLDLYGIEVSPQLISSVTDAVLEEVGRWQSRPLDPLYALAFFDALRVKMRDEGTVRNKAVYLAIGVTPDGREDVLGIWIEQTEGAKFWLRVMTEIRSRGVNDILIAIVDGLQGFPEAINAVFAETQIQTCIVHYADLRLCRPSVSGIGRRRRSGSRGRHNQRASRKTHGPMHRNALVRSTGRRDRSRIRCGVVFN